LAARPIFSCPAGAEAELLLSVSFLQKALGVPDYLAFAAVEARGNPLRYEPLQLGRKGHVHGFSHCHELDTPSKTRLY
jgi:hypothetical protein